MAKQKHRRKSEEPEANDSKSDISTLISTYLSNNNFRSKPVSPERDWFQPLHPEANREVIKNLKTALDKSHCEYKGSFDCTKGTLTLEINEGIPAGIEAPKDLCGVLSDRIRRVFTPIMGGAFATNLAQKLKDANAYDDNFNLFLREIEEKGFTATFQFDTFDPMPYGWAHDDKYAPREVKVEDTENSLNPDNKLATTPSADTFSPVMYGSDVSPKYKSRFEPNILVEMSEIFSYDPEELDDEHFELYSEDSADADVLIDEHDIEMTYA